MRRILVIGLAAALFSAPLDAFAAKGGNGGGDGGGGGGGGGGGSAPKPTAGTYNDAACRSTDPVTGADDPCAGRLWGVSNIKAPQAWDSSTGVGVTVAVVDTGVDFGHPDLAANLLSVPGSNLLKNTAYVCPFQTPGRKATSSNAIAQDDEGHGTHVAGTIAAVRNNRVGVAGVAPEAKVLPVKVLDAAGTGSLGDIARGICFAADQGAKVINLSLGADVVGEILITGLPDDQIENAVEYAVRKGAVVVVAAGNDAIPICEYPSALPAVLCVGAVDRNDVKAWYSSHGQDLDVVAPGGSGTLLADDDIWSTIWPGSAYDLASDGYDTAAGTSMAAPHVAAVAALVLAHMPLTPAQVHTRLTATADDLGTPGFDLAYGYGRVNACRAVGACL